MRCASATWTRYRCGCSRARDLDPILAEVFGEACLRLGFRNDSLSSALRREIADRNANVERDLGHEFTAFVIPASNPHVRMRKPTQRKNVR